MGLFRTRSQKSSCDASNPPRVTIPTLTEKVEALRSELNVLDDELRDIVDHQNALHEQLGSTTLRPCSVILAPRTRVSPSSSQ
jgi:hypothetical protein